MLLEYGEQSILHRIGLICMEEQRRAGRVRDRIVLLPAAHFHKKKIEAFAQVKQKARQLIDCVDMIPVDLRSGMTAGKAAELYFQQGSLRRYPLRRKGCIDAQPARAADQHNTLVLGIHIDQTSSFQYGSVERLRPVHSGFLVRGNQNLKRRMPQRIVCKQRHTVGNCDAVVPAERCPPRSKHIPLSKKLQPLVLKIMPHSLVRHADHVHVALKDHRRALPAALRSRLSDQDVFCLVLHVFQSAFPRKLHKEITDFFVVSGASRNSGKLREKAQHIFIIQLRNQLIQLAHCKHSLPCAAAAISGRLFLILSVNLHPAVFLPLSALRLCFRPANLSPACFSLFPSSGISF